MKRFAFWFVAALIAVSWVSHRHDNRPPGPARAVRTKMIVRSEASSDKSGRGQRVYIVESDDHRLVTIDDQGVHLSNENVKSLDHDEDDNDDNDNDILASADGLPVRIVPGSRVTEARIEAPRPPEPPKPPKAPKPPKHVRVKHQPHKPLVTSKPVTIEEEIKPLVVAGRLSATEPRAINDARVQLLQKLPGLLDPNVPRDWPVPNRLIDGMIRETKVVPVERDYGTLYQATMLVDASPRKRAEVASAYRHEQVLKRLVTLGGLLTFVLISLGTLSGYIRADEATKGYYTNRLRLAAAAGVGVAGTVIYQMLT